MPVSRYADAQKTGLDRIIKLAKAMCLLVLTFRTIIDAKFPDSVPIQALMTAIAALCPLIAAADEEYQAYQLSTLLPPSDSADISGINPDADPAADPDIV